MLRPTSAKITSSTSISQYSCWSPENAVADVREVDAEQHRVRRRRARRRRRRSR